MQNKSVRDIEIHKQPQIILEMMESLLVLDNTHYSLSVILNNLIENNKIAEDGPTLAMQEDIALLEQEIHRLKEKIVKTKQILELREL